MYYKINDNVINYALSSDEQILYNSKTEELIVVNQTGIRIWQLIKEGLKNEDIIFDILTHYHDQDIETVKNDVNQYIYELNDKKYLHIVED